MTAHQLLRPRADLHAEELDGDVVVLEPATGLLHVLSGTASVAWSVLRAGGTRSAVIEQVTGMYGVDDDAAAIAELAEFLDDLVRRGLVVHAG